MHTNSLLFKLCALWSISAPALADSRFYYSGECSGDYASFSADNFNYCYVLSDGYAKSLYDNKKGSREHWVAFSTTSDQGCGGSVCSFSQLGSTNCCTSKKKNIKGAAVYSYAFNIKDGAVAPMADKNSGSNNKRNVQSATEGIVPVDAVTAAGCIDVKKIGEVFVELPDGTHHGLGKGAARVTAEELQRQLGAKGKPKLSDEKITQLKEDGIVE